MKKKEKVLTVKLLSDRLDQILENMSEWKDRIDQTAEYSDFSRSFIRSSCGFDQVVSRIEKAMNELDQNNLFAAKYHLDQAEVHYLTVSVNGNEFVSAIKEVINFKRGRIRAGKETAKILKNKAAEREAYLKSEAKKIQKLHPYWSVAEISRRLSERHGLGGQQSIYRKIFRLLRNQ